MYSSKKSVQQLVGLLKAHELKQIVLSPGSRNSPITCSLANDPFFTCHTVVDERSAGFYALGIAQHTGKGVAVCCTSGTAVLNYAPAVAEAYYQRLPLVVITADRPAAWIEQMDGQTLPQPGVFNTLVKKSVQLPEIASEEDEWYANRLINEALLAMTHRACGPVHINVPLSEPLFEYETEQLPEVRKITRNQLPIVSEAVFLDYQKRFLKYKKTMVIAGQSVDPGMTDALNKLILMHDCVVLTEHISGIPPLYFFRNFDATLGAIPEEKLENYLPDLLITVGGHIISKRIKQILRAHPPKEHWHLSPSGEIVDTYQCLTEVVEADAVEFINYLSNHQRDPYIKKPFTLRWMYACVIPAPKVEFSDVMAVGALMKALPKDANLQLANSTSVRLAHLFRPLGQQRIYSNRGTSGIDGCLSTALGQAAVSPNPTFLLIGDLAFFYDMNALWNQQLSKNLRILLNNNGGGEIFHTLPGFKPSEAMEKYVVASHSWSARAWAEDRGFTYLSASDEQELTEQMPVFTAEGGDKPVLLEVFSSKEKNAEILQNYYNTLKQYMAENVNFTPRY
ncbi:MAG: 2-succinyl-5-enolpyruvyl-6-hydroxy-3-cyclohexene-1-carboxylic-acid synthase [Tannerellaceae bacterium]|jgi:2-succinyl-5-enolpyruvyl-6-hydroxy-3-cyclohexene-1-carboxylate synthase|nr:2-succinyl-5-enolpyruvyl-6-hydroxy-3-cyclohexene-1-carboxylic-acid synthase [Tannerellaceae bacterium]